MAAHTQGPVTILPVQTKADKREFVELAFRLNRGDPAWVPPLKGELFDLLTPGKNPWFEHGKAQLLLARRDGRSEEHTSELQSLMRNSYAVFCLKKNIQINKKRINPRRTRIETLYNKEKRNIHEPLQATSNNRVKPCTAQ